MKIAIVGSTDFKRLEAIREFMLALPRDTEVISASRRGVGLTVSATALALGLGLTEVFPNFKAHGKGANFERDRMVVEQCDWLVAFWDGQSSGTAHIIGVARDAGKLGKIVYDELRHGETT